MANWIKRWITVAFSFLLTVGTIWCTFSMVSSNENIILVLCMTILSFFSIFQLCRILKDAYENNRKI